MRYQLLLALLVGCAQPVVEEPSNPEPIAEPLVVVEEEDAGVEEDLPEPTETVPVAALSVAKMMNRMRRREAVRRSRWLVPTDREELRQETLLALVRVAISEEGWANPTGMKALWQTTRSARGCLTEDNYAVSCRHSQATRRRAPPVHGLWRHSPYATGRLPSASRRQRWVSTVTLDCEQPSGWPPPPYAEWRSYQRHCERLVEVAESIVDEEDDIQACPAGSRPIAWGCDPVRRQAIREVLGRDRAVAGCNDTPIARRRQLQRLDCGETENAFWCRPGTPHCDTLPESEIVLQQRLSGETDGETDLRGGESPVQETSEGVQRGELSPPRPVVLDLHGVSRGRERQARSGPGDRS